MEKPQDDQLKASFAHEIARAALQVDQKTIDQVWAQYDTDKQHQLIHEAYRRGGRWNVDPKYDDPEAIRFTKAYLAPRYKAYRQSETVKQILIGSQKSDFHTRVDAAFEWCRQEQPVTESTRHAINRTGITRLMLNAFTQTITQHPPDRREQIVSTFADQIATNVSSEQDSPTYIMYFTFTNVLEAVSKP